VDDSSAIPRAVTAVVAAAMNRVQMDPAVDASTKPVPNALLKPFHVARSPYDSDIMDKVENCLGITRV
jgi:hypothetical protein